MAREQDARKLILQMGMSLDGIVAVPTDDGNTPVMAGRRGAPPEDPELTELKLKWLSETGAHLMGRVTYEQMSTAWPTSTHAYAAPMNERPKVVFSQTLEQADWHPSRIGRGDLAEEIAQLKNESGDDLVAWGGGTFAQSLARADLIDEYRLTIHPIAVGSGLRIFEDLPHPLTLELVEERSFSSATVHVYRRID